MKKKKIESFLTKLLKFLLFLLALLVIFVISAPYLLKLLHSRNEVYIKPTLKTPDDTKETEYFKAKGSERAKSERYHPKTLEQTAEEVSKYNTKSRKAQKVPSAAVPQTLAQKYQVEPEATSAHLTQRIGSAKKDLGFIRAYLSQGVNPNQVIENDSPAFLAARTWNLPVLKELGAIDFSATTSEGWTIMHMVCTEDPKEEETKRRAIDTIEYLLKADGEIDAINRTNGYSPLMYAIIKKNAKMVEILLEQFGANACGPFEKGFEVNPLILAMRIQDQNIIMFLLHYKADFLAYNRNGISAAQEAVIREYFYGIELFIELDDYEAKIDAKNIQVPKPEDVGEVGSELWHSGATLLHFAVARNHFKVAKHLILRYEVNIALKDADGFTAFDRAVEHLRRYTSGAQNYTDQFEEDRKTAEKIVDLFHSGKEEQKEYGNELEAQIRKNMYKYSQAEMIKEDEEEEAKAREYLLSLGLF